MKKKIFGKTFKISSCARWKDGLRQAVELYDDSDGLDVELNILDKSPISKPTSRNPSVLHHFSGGFEADFGSVLVSWVVGENGVLKVNAFFRDPCSIPFVSFIRKLRSKEFFKKAEWFEQVLFELVLVPTAHFFSDLAVIHAATVGTNEKCLLLTGTGGVGKSSALLSVAKNPDISFLSDDIVIVDEKGLAYGNFAWPKIYGYNCEGNDFSYELLANRGLLDRVHFYVRKAINPSSVRRKIRPDRLFGSCLANGVHVDSVIFLFKEQCQNIFSSGLSKENAIDSTISIMKAEYDVFYKFIEWDSYNSSMVGESPVLTQKTIEKWWRDNLINVYEANLEKISIPLEVNHLHYQEWMSDLIESRLL